MSEELQPKAAGGVPGVLGVAPAPTEMAEGLVVGAVDTDPNSQLYTDIKNSLKNVWEVSRLLVKYYEAIDKPNQRGPEAQALTNQAVDLGFDLDASKPAHPSAWAWSIDPIHTGESGQLKVSPHIFADFGRDVRPQVRLEVNRASNRELLHRSISVQILEGMENVAELLYFDINEYENRGQDAEDLDLLDA